MLPQAKDVHVAVIEQVLENYMHMFTDLHRRVFQLQASIRSKREIMNIQARSNS